MGRLHRSPDRGGAARGREQEIEQRIRGLSEELAELDRNFAELASGVDPRSIAPQAESSDLNLSTEVRDLLGPLLNELKRATPRPREIDRLRTDIAQLEDRLGPRRGHRGRAAALAARSRLDPQLAIPPSRSSARCSYSWSRSTSSVNARPTPGTAG